jgi:hypothetical protein
MNPTAKRKIKKAKPNILSKVFTPRFLIFVLSTDICAFKLRKAFEQGVPREMAIHHWAIYQGVP